MAQVDLEKSRFPRLTGGEISYKILRKELNYCKRHSGRSAAWLARLLWEQEAGGSNPPVPTSYFNELRLEGCSSYPIRV
jgi:hypothetical protein